MNILAIGSHPDDIEIGCGGTLLRYAKAGHEVNLLVLTAGESGGDKERRMAEQENAKIYMEVRSLCWGEFQDTELPRYGKSLITGIEKALSITKPDVVFSHYGEDTHQDHCAAALATISACRYVKEVLFYEVPTTHNFQPDIFVDIGEVVESKMFLLKCHSSQIEKTGIRHFSLMKEVESYANFRGVQAKVEYAEGFKAWRVLKHIEALV